MTKRSYIIGIWGILAACLLGACSKDDGNDIAESYPSLITEFMDVFTDKDGCGNLLATDKGCVYAISQPLQGLQPDAVYRIVGGYVLTDRTDGTYQVVELRTAETVLPLRLTDTAADDLAPVQVTSIWTGGGYLNLNLSPKTQGGRHEWGYRIDGIRDTETGRTYDLSLVHRQPDDPQSYSITVYASLPVDDIADDLQTGDSISMTVLTFSGNKTWRFAYRDKENSEEIKQQALNDL